MMQFNRKDFATGVIFAGFALAYGYMALFTMRTGSAGQMGPGFFPITLCAALLVIAAILILRSFSGPGESPFGVFAWRPVILLTLAIVVFAATADGLGMLPGIFVAGLIACGASRTMTPLLAVLVSAGMAVFCVLVFTLGLGVPLPILGTWFG